LTLLGKCEQTGENGEEPVPAENWNGDGALTRKISDGRLRIAVAICTYRRNEPLRLLLTKLAACADRVRDRAAVGVVLVDDTAAGEARGVADEFANAFELGVYYRVSGHQNISLARNSGLDVALQFADWIAMTDDDCEPDPDWLKEFLAVQERTDADTITGALRRRAPPGAPSWLTEQPFMDVGISHAMDGAACSTAATNCSMIRAEWLRHHPEIRFDPDLGVLGGEDMVFYRQARAKGLRINFSSAGFVYENQPASRLSLRYQIARSFWEGNSSYVTCVQDGDRPLRMLAHGIACFARAVRRPFTRLIRRKAPHWRYCLAEIANSVGKVLGFFGVRIRHH
jgi:succinoglycan biosynthesis protein ExoM